MSRNFRPRHQPPRDGIDYNIKQSALRVNVKLVLDVAEDVAESFQDIRTTFTATCEAQHNRAVSDDHHVRIMLLECGLNKWQDLIELQRVLAALKTPTERDEPLQLVTNTIVKHSTTSQELTLYLSFARVSVDTLWRYANALMLRLQSCGILSEVVLPKDTLTLPIASKVLRDHDRTNDNVQWEGKLVWSEVLLGVASGENEEIQRVFLSPAESDKSTPVQFPGLVPLVDEMLSSNVDPNKPIVIILRGIPGSGKSTLRREIKRISAQQGVTFTSCSADDFFETKRGYVFESQKLGAVHNKCKAVFKTAVHGVSSRQHIVLVDNTNTQRWEYQPYEDIATKFGCQVHIVELKCPDVLAAYRMSKRNSHGVPTDKVVSMFLRWEEDIRAHNFSPHFQHSTLSANPLSDGSTVDNVTYLGLFLDDESKRKLVARIPPMYPSKSAEHVTLFYKPNEQYIRDAELGALCTVYGVEVVHDSYGQALRVELDERLPVQVKNKIPHITLSTGIKVNASYSNKLLESPMAKRRTIDPPIELKARIGAALFVDNQRVTTTTSPSAVEVTPCDHLGISRDVDSLPDPTTPASRNVFILFVRECDFVDDTNKTATKLFRRAQVIHLMDSKCTTHRLLCIQKTQNSSPSISSLLRAIRFRCLLLSTNIFDDVVVLSSPSFDVFETMINDYFNVAGWQPTKQITMLTTVKESLQWPRSKLKAVGRVAWSVSHFDLEQGASLYNPVTLFSVLDVLGINVEEQTRSVVLRGMNIVRDAWTRVLGPEANTKDFILRRLDTTLLGLTTDIIELGLVLPNETALSDITTLQMKLARELDGAQGIRRCIGSSSDGGLLFFSLCTASSYDPVFCVHMIPRSNDFPSGIYSNSVAQFEFCEQQELSRRELVDSEPYVMVSALVRSILFFRCNSLLSSKCRASSLINLISERLVLEYCKSLDQCCPLPSVDDVTSERIIFTLYEMLTHFSRKGVDEWMAVIGSSLEALLGNTSARIAWSHVMTNILQNCMSVVTSRGCDGNHMKKGIFVPENHLDVLVELFDADASVTMGASSVRTLIEVPSHIEWTHVHSYALCDKLRLAVAAVVPPDDDCTQFFSCVPSSVARRIDVTASALDELRRVLVKFHALEAAEHDFKSALLGHYFIRGAETDEELRLSIESVAA
ncbi:hypothetical protein PsorP6_014491 [Peronosclerospora sorghi]|uniref:Uncharacterized protein n=1 Tax=Peronosclerospora sorghi TaxID=230839 RepID=A0ACC0VTA1_9STRA|nr:hypothetical protein PsorP6_014491 [Peronosclerospora sorghi]